MSAFIWVISFAVIFVLATVFAERQLRNEYGSGKFSKDQLFRRDVMQFLQGGLDSEEMPSTHQIHHNTGFSDKMLLNPGLMRNQATCTHFKVEKRIALDGRKFRPEIIDEVYCVNTGDIRKRECRIGNMTCNQKYEKFYLSWRKEGINSCYSEPFHYYRPSGCECKETF